MMFKKLLTAALMGALVMAAGCTKKEGDAPQAQGVTQDANTGAPAANPPAEQTGGGAAAPDPAATPMPEGHSHGDGHAH